MLYRTEHISRIDILYTENLKKGKQAALLLRKILNLQYSLTKFKWEFKYSYMYITYIATIVQTIVIYYFDYTTWVDKNII